MHHLEQRLKDLRESWIYIANSKYLNGTWTIKIIKKIHGSGSEPGIQAWWLVMHWYALAPSLSIVNDKLTGQTLPPYQLEKFFQTFFFGFFGDCAPMSSFAIWTLKSRLCSIIKYLAFYKPNLEFLAPNFTMLFQVQHGARAVRTSRKQLLWKKMWFQTFKWFKHLIA